MPDWEEEEPCTECPDIEKDHTHCVACGQVLYPPFTRDHNGELVCRTCGARDAIQGSVEGYDDNDPTARFRSYNREVE